METNTLSLNTAFCGSNTTTGTAYPIGDYYPLINTYYQPYLPYWRDESKIEKSFKLVQKLIEKKIIKEPKTVKDFIDLVNLLSDTI